MTPQWLHRLVPAVFTSRSGLPWTVPGPEARGWLGGAGPMLRWGGDPLGHARSLFRQYGDVVALVRGGGTRCISSDPACPGTVLTYGASNTETATTLHHVFGKGNLSGALYPGPDPAPRQRPLLTFGAGLFGVNGDEHRRHRRLLTPAFSRARLDGYRDEMVAAATRELDSWQVGTVRDVAVDMRRLTLNVVSAAMFGRATDTNGEQASADLQAALRLMGLPLTRVLPRDVRGLPFRRFLDAVGRIEDEVRGIIDATRRGPPGNAMLSELLRARDEESGTTLTEDELVGHVSVIFTAGHETSSNSLTWTLLLLAAFPDAARRLDEELRSVLGGSPPDVQALESLPFLDAVVKESLRLMTPAPWNGRVLLEPAQLGGHELPRGTEVLVSIYETHRIPEVFARPLVFSPSRWETLRPSVYEYNPFSAGQRICIGARFALMEMKIVLAMLLQRFRLGLVPQRVDRFAEMVLTPKHGLRLLVCPADRQFERSPARLTGDIHEMVDLPPGLRA